MKASARILALLLAVLMLVAVFAGCNKPAEDPSSSEVQSSSSVEPSSSSVEPSSSSVEPASSSVVEPSSSVEPASSSETPVVTKDPKATATKAPKATATKAPAKKYAAEPKVDLGGFKLRIRSKYLSAAAAPSDSASAKTKAVAKQIDDAKKALNFDVIATVCSTDYADYATVKQAIQAGNKNIGHIYETTMPLALAGYASKYFIDLRTIDAEKTGFDIDDPDRFWQGKTKACALDGAQFGVCMIGNDESSIGKVFMGIHFMFNKAITEKHGYSAASIYKMVRDYKWTLDAAEKIINACYEADSNGDGKAEVYGLLSYDRQHKYYLNLNKDTTVTKVNGQYKFTANSKNIMVVFEWLQRMYQTNKVAAPMGASAVREAFMNGQGAFLQCAGGYIVEKQMLAKLDYFQANIGIIPSPVGPAQIALKKYANSCSNSNCFVIPAINTGADREKAATALAAIALRVNSVDDYKKNLYDMGVLRNKDDIDMAENYLWNCVVTDPGYVTEITGTSGVDPLSCMVGRVTGFASSNPGTTLTASESVAYYENIVNKQLKEIYKITK